MGEGSNVRFSVIGVLFLLLALTRSFASGGEDMQPRWRKATLFGETSSSSMIQPLNRAGSSSIVFPLHGNVYPLGFYNVTFNIGRPPRPYFLDVDTGSDLTWLQCDAPCVHCTAAPHPFYRPFNNLVHCKDPICESLQPPGQRCENPQQCDYEVEYADGGSSLGVLVEDSFLLNFTSGARITPVLALGCGYDQQLKSEYYHPIDGILGLGRGKSSIISQLSSQGFVRNIVGHCLSSRGGGFLFFGDGIYDSSPVTWTPMARDYPKHYAPGLAELIFAGKSTGLRDLFVVFDSGSSYTYLNSQAYQYLISWIEKELSGKSLKRALDDKTLPICWKGRKPFKSLSEVKKYFKSLAMSFGDGGKGRVLFEFTAETYLILSSKGNVCLGILNGSEVGLKVNVIGDISMQDRIVIYDNERQAIGWIPANCDRIPKARISRI